MDSSFMTTMSDDIHSISLETRRAIECPICYGLTVDFGFDCINGHIVCRLCMLNLTIVNRADRCPSCRGKLLTKSPMLMRLKFMFAYANVACVNRANGCRIIDKIARIGEHETQCEYSK